MQREFPQHASEWFDPVGRRNFLKLMGASLALAGVTACTRQPEELIVPYVRQPENLVPGRPLFFATAMPLGGVVDRRAAESHEGRPTKIEGNPITRQASARPTRTRRRRCCSSTIRIGDSHHLPRGDPSVGHVRAVAMQALGSERQCRARGCGF